MALNGSKKVFMEWRRQQVADRLRAGTSQRAIAGQLGVSVATINHDVRILNARWREAANVDTAAHRARQLADIERIKAALWRSGALSGSAPQIRVLLQAIKLEAQITGVLAAPSFTLNVTVVNALEKAIAESGIPPESVGEAFEDYFKGWAAERQMQEQTDAAERQG